MRVYYHQNANRLGSDREDYVWYNDEIVLIRTDKHHHIVEGIVCTYKRQDVNACEVSDIASVPEKDQPPLEELLREQKFSKPIGFR